MPRLVQSPRGHLWRATSFGSEAGWQAAGSLRTVSVGLHHLAVHGHREGQAQDLQGHKGLAGTPRSHKPRGGPATVGAPTPTSLSPRPGPLLWGCPHPWQSRSIAAMLPLSLRAGPAHHRHGAPGPPRAQRPDPPSPWAWPLWALPAAARPVHSVLGHVPPPKLLEGPRALPLAHSPSCNRHLQVPINLASTAHCLNPRNGSNPDDQGC